MDCRGSWAISQSQCETDGSDGSFESRRAPKKPRKSRIRRLWYAFGWYAQQDSNLRPLAPQTNALSRLSYGHTVEKSHVILIYKEEIMQARVMEGAQSI